MFIELYTYRIREGAQEDWTRFMVERAIPFQTAAGMVILGHFWDRDDPQWFWWMRRFESQEHREELYQKVYESHDWITNYRPEVYRLIERGHARTVTLVPTPGSPVR